MSFLTALKSFFIKTKIKVETTDAEILNYVEKHSDIILNLMEMMDAFYDKAKGSEKMKKVIGIAVVAINAKFKLSLDPENTSDETVKAIEGLFQKLYDNIYKVSVRV